MDIRAFAAIGTAALLLTSPRSASSYAEPTLEGITVWARKRATELQELPLAAAVLSDRELAARGLHDLGDIAEQLPTLDLQRTVSATTTTLRIRRVGNLGNIPTFEPAVGLYVDGVYRSRSLLGTSDMPDVERVEVLHGPQSALYGKNASAGIVAFYTKPPAESFAGWSELTGGWLDAPGSPGLIKSKLSLSGPLTEALRAGFAATYSRHGHTLSSELPGGPDANDDDRLAMRAQLLWAPSEDLELRLLAGYAREQDDQGEADVYLAPGAISSSVAEILRNAGWSAACGDNVPHNRRSCSLAVTAVNYDALDLTLLGRYRMPNGWTLTSRTGWDRYDVVRHDDDITQMFAPLLFFHDSEAGSSLQEELLVTSDGGPVSWLAGAFYYRNNYDRGGEPTFGPVGPAAFDPFWASLLGVPLALPGQSGVHDSHLETRYVSLFGNVDWRLTDRISLATALRWQREEKEAVINNSVTRPGGSLISVVLTPAVAAGGAPVNGSIARTSDDIVWSVTPQLRMTDALLGYLTVARGAKAGGFNTTFGNAPLAAREFDDERIMHYELGARGTFANERGRFSAAVFNTTYRDYQDAAFLSAQFSVGNADRVDLEGFELEGAMLFGERIAIDLAVSMADLTYASNTTGMCFPGRTPDGAVPRSCDLSGEHPINAPVWVAHAGLQYDHPMSWADLYVRLDWSWTDEYNTSFSADPRLVQEAYSDVSLRIGAQFGTAYEVVFWGDNLLGEEVTHIDAVLSLFNDPSYQSFMAEPRRYGVTVRARF